MIKAACILVCIANSASAAVSKPAIMTNNGRVRRTQYCLDLLQFVKISTHEHAYTFGGNKTFYRVYANAILFDSLGCLDGRRCIFRDQRTASRYVILTRMQAVSSNCWPYSTSIRSKRGDITDITQDFFFVCVFFLFTAHAHLVSPDGIVIPTAAIDG